MARYLPVSGSRARPSSRSDYGTAGLDLPTGLDGSKRKRRLIMGVVIVVVLAVGGTIGSSILSYTGH